MRNSTESALRSSSAAAAFAKDPTGKPTELHHDLWAKRGGFGLFVKQMLREHGLTTSQLEDSMRESDLGPPSFQKSQLQRWLYEDGMPQADNIRLLSEGIAGAAGGPDAKRKAVNPLRLRLRLHLFAGCLAAFKKVRVLVGTPRAEKMAAALNMQVHRAFEAFQASARNPPLVNDEVLDADTWLKERRMLARKAVLFGIGPATPGSWLLRDTGDHDLATLSDPRWMLGGAQGEHRQRLERFMPEIGAGQDAVRSVLRQLSLDDIVSDASGDGRQPLGWLGLIERVLRSRLPD